MARTRTNIAYNFAYQLLVLALPLVTAPYLSRVIGAEGVGVYSYSYSIASYFVYIAMLGLNNYGNRSIAACRERREDVSRTFWSIYTMQALCSFVAISLYGVYSVTLAGNFEIALMQGLYVISALFDINWFFFGIEQFRLTVLRNALVKCVATVLIFVFVKSVEDIGLYVGIMCGSFLVSQLCLWPFLARYADFYRPKLADIVIHIKPNLVLFVPVVAVSMYNILSKIILGYMAGTEEVGYFENAVKIASVPVTLVSAVGAVMLPRTSALIARGDFVSASRHTEKTLLIVMAFTSLAGFGIPAIAVPFSELFYGPGFETSGYCLAVLSAAIPLLGFGNVIRTQYILPKARDSVFLWSALCGAFVNLSIKIALVPHIGALGAAIASVGAEIAVLAYQLIRIRREIPMKRYLMHAGAFVFIGAAMGVVVAFVPSAGSDLSRVLLLVAVGLAVYVPPAFALLRFYLKKQFQGSGSK